MRKSCQESQKQTVGKSFYSKFGKRVKNEVHAWTWFTQSGLYKDCTKTIQQYSRTCFPQNYLQKNTEYLRARPLQHRGHFHC